MPPRILVLSFSPIASDARVLRHVDVLNELGAVTTCGFGPAPSAAHEHIEVTTSASLPQTPGGVALLAARRWAAAEFAAPALRDAQTKLRGARYDLVVANDARALPLAFAVAAGSPVWADMHEWAPEENVHDWRWRLLVAPFAVHLCRRYLPAAAAVTTVGGEIANLYRSIFGVDCGVVRNTRPFVELEPSPLDGDRIRLVHSGIAAPDRFLDRTVGAVRALDGRFSLDLFLMPGGDGGRCLRSLRKLAQDDRRITFHAPVAPMALPSALNQFDVGVFQVPPVHTNTRLTLPNKLFDFVQARLAVVVSPLVEMKRVVQDHGIGVVTAGYTSHDLVSTLSGLTAEGVRTMKEASNANAELLSSRTDAETVRALAARLLAGER